MADLALVADIGGTNTRVALARQGAIEAASVRRFANAEASGIDAVLRRYLGEIDVDRTAIGGACVAGAGPVRDGAVELTNLDWRVAPDILRDTLGAGRVAVLNDLQAQGFAIGHSDPDTITQVLPQAKDPLSDTKLVVGLGTGVNAAPVFETPGGRMVMPSECGHVSLPEGADHRVSDALRAKFGFASIEEALSGRGIGQVHEALHGRAASAAEVMAGADARDGAALETVAEVVRLIGAFVGDLALIFLPFGGIYLIGGVTRNLAPWLTQYDFAEAMQDKGRFGPFLQQFGVSVVTDDYAALTGCAAHLADLS